MNQISSQFSAALTLDEQGDLRGAYNSYVQCAGLISAQLARLFAPGQQAIKPAVATKLFTLARQSLERAEEIACAHFPGMKRSTPPRVTATEPTADSFEAMFPTVPSPTASIGAASASASAAVGSSSVMSTASTVRSSKAPPKHVPVVQSTLPQLLTGASAATAAIRREAVTPDALRAPRSPLLLYKEDTIARLKVAEERLAQYENSTRYAQPPNHLQNVRRLTEDIRILQSRRAGIEDDLRRSVGFALLDLDMRIVAEQLALMAFERYCKVNMDELHLAASTGGACSSASVVAFMAWQRHVRRWLMAEVLRAPTPRDRGDVLTALITVAFHAFDVLHNFEVAGVVLSALSSAAVVRLAKSWSHVPRATMAQLEQLRVQFNAADEYRALRLTLSRMTPPLQPYLAMFMRDLASLETDYSTGSGLTEAGVRVVEAVADQLKRFQEEAPPAITANLAVQHYMVTRDTVSDVSALQLSFQLEPAGKKEQVIVAANDLYEDYLARFVERQSESAGGADDNDGDGDGNDAGDQAEPQQPTHAALAPSPAPASQTDSAPAVPRRMDPPSAGPLFAAALGTVPAAAPARASDESADAVAVDGAAADVAAETDTAANEDDESDYVRELSVRLQRLREEGDQVELEAPASDDDENGGDAPVAAASTEPLVQHAPQPSPSLPSYGPPLSLSDNPPAYGPGAADEPTAVLVARHDAKAPPSPSAHTSLPARHNPQPPPPAPQPSRVDGDDDDDGVDDDLMARLNNLTRL